VTSLNAFRDHKMHLERSRNAFKQNKSRDYKCLDHIICELSNELTQLDMN
jgi:predicted transposase YbfD/YdcC